MKKSIIGVVAGALFGWAGLTFSQALPVYTPPANRLGGALAEGITQNLLRRGFAMNDPRIISTIEAVGARLIPLASAAGGGATWITVVSRLSPWVLAGVLVYEGVKWYFDAQGNVTTKANSSTVGAVEFGNTAWSVGGAGPWFASPEEAAGWYQLNTSVFVKVYNFSLYGQDLGQDGFRYWVSGQGDRGDTGWTGQGFGPIFVYRGASPATCATGQAAQGSACIPTGLTADNFSPGAQLPVVQSMQQAYDALPDSAKSSALSSELAAELANRLWREAALNPDYRGVPFSANEPVSSSDFSPHQAAHPNDWPSTSDMNLPIPTDSSPIKSPNVNPNQVSSAASGAIQLDLGPDPGTPQPVFEEPPSDLFKPIKDLMQPWLAFQVPAHDTQCPTWQAAPSIAGNVFNIDISSHCEIVETHRGVIAAAALLCWLAVGAFIVLSA